MFSSLVVALKVILVHKFKMLEFCIPNTFADFYLGDLVLKDFSVFLVFSFLFMVIPFFFFYFLCFYLIFSLPVEGNDLKRFLFLFVFLFAVSPIFYYIFWLFIDDYILYFRMLFVDLCSGILVCRVIILLLVTLFPLFYYLLTFIYLYEKASNSLKRLRDKTLD